MSRSIARSPRWFSLLGLGFVLAAPLAGQRPVVKPLPTGKPQPVEKPGINRNPTVMPNTLPPNAGRYRVMITGFGVARQTVDEALDSDGKGDEVYAAAAAVLWDRRNGQLISEPLVIRSREYGDVARGQFTGRFRAGTAGPTGGLWAGNGPEYAPLEFDPRGSAFPVPSAYQFPLLVFEGGLSDGVEALLIAPSLWESDLKPSPFDNYQQNWRAGGVAKVLASPAVANQFANPALTSAMIPEDPGLRIASSLVTVFTGGLIGSYGFGGIMVQSRIDRPIGLTGGQQAAHYQDRVVVVTREKLTSLVPGAGTTMAIPFAEPFNNFLNGIYTMYLRIERLQ